MGGINNIGDAISYIKTKLNNFYETNEIDSFVYIIMEHLMAMSRIDVQMDKARLINQDTINTIDTYLLALQEYKPIQYIIGETEFYDLKFYVTKDTLIPRPETEELVQLIIQNNILPQAKILDIGTGSGCIPISLSKNIPLAKVFSVDISHQAINVAKQNAIHNNVSIEFMHRNILLWENYNWNTTYDIIVSNPPYVRILEKEFMHKNVLQYEPDLALFVSNDNPLIFYSRIADLALERLNKGGFLYFEINEFLGEDMIKLLAKKGFVNISLIKDLNGRDRMMKAEKK